MWRKIVQNLLTFDCLICSKKTAKLIPEKLPQLRNGLVVETCPPSHWIAFLMLYRLVYNIHSHFSELILAWSAYHKENIVNLCWTEGWQIRCRTQIPRNIFTKSWADKFEEKSQKFWPKAKVVLPLPWVWIGLTF